MTDVPRLLNALEHADPHAASRLLPLVYDEQAGGAAGGAGAETWTGRTCGRSSFMRALQLPDGNLLIPLTLPEAEDGFALKELAPEQPNCGPWPGVVKSAEEPRPTPKE
jgi:hypothetical protein